MSDICPQIPREPRQGEQPEAIVIIQIIRCLRFILPRLSPSVLSRHRGGEETVIPDAPLILTLKQPSGFTLPHGETRTPVFVSWGLVGFLEPSNINDPVIYINPAVDATVYVGVQVGISKTVVGFVSSATLIHTTNLADFTGQAASYDSSGSPPATYKIRLGNVVAASGALTLNNAGAGSIQIESNVIAVSLTGSGALATAMSFTQALGYRRN
ncbi:MAG TPA: hypothetical protein VL357_06060 [Rariglobus sp.]|jgi:hypothetical protein|nr:hypothetical protein [Rariglobus sp.]